MIPQSKTATVTTFCKLQKLRAKLIQIHSDGSFKNLPFHKRTSLFKRYKRYLKKLISVEHPLSKAVSLFALAMLFSAEIDAQAPCRKFVHANVSNPIERQTLPFTINKPAFVDIDNDGDLDCYGIYPYNHYQADSIHFVFLRNTGSKTLPAFQLDGTGGLPDTSNILYDTGVEGPVFADIDGDGDYDCFIGKYGDRGNGFVEYFENVGDKTNPAFVERSPDQNPLKFVHGSYGLFFNLVDIDSDGDYDLFISDVYSASFFENTGDKSNPEFILVRYNPGWYIYYGYRVFTDWNHDGLIDIITAGRKVPNDFYRNDGTATDPHFVVDLANKPILPDGFYLHNLVDLNNDGFAEAFSVNGDYAVTSPVAVIQATNNGTTTKLDAYPKGSYPYQWKRNGVNIANATTDFIEVSQPGLYTVEITGDCGTGISLPYRLKSNNEIIASAKENLLSPGSKNISLQLYPNPFTDECVLKFDKGITGKAIIHVTDAQGRLVVSMNVNNSNAHFGKELKTGIYFVQVIQNNDIIFRKKIIKQ